MDSVNVDLRELAVSIHLIASQLHVLALPKE